MKVLYIDVETTGKDPVKHDIWQLAMIISIDGVVKGEWDYRIKPLKPKNADPEALKVGGITIEETASFMAPAHAYKAIVSVLDSFVDKFDKTDKFYPSGYLVRFDLDFLNQFFKKNKDEYFGSYVNWRALDPLPFLHFMEFAGKIKLPNYKLATVCDHFGIPIHAHDALSDIRATREVCKRVMSQELISNL